MTQAPKIKSLWGDLPIENTIRTPYVILKEQASILTKATNGLLFGRVSRRSIQDKNHSKYNFYCWLDIAVPSINNYSILIVEMSYPNTFYPVEISTPVIDHVFEECHSEEALDSILGQILSSNEVRRVISGLLSEVRLDENEKSEF